MEYFDKCTSLELEEIMGQYGAMVYRLAYSRTRCPADADDIYQEVFIRYFQKRPVFDSEEHRRAWLLRVTVNRCRTLFASAWFRHRAALEECAGQEERKETQLDEALQALRPGDRTVLHLFYYEEMSVRELAELLKLSQSAVTTRLSRARAKLKSQLTEVWQDER